jgi:tight adherence protein B
VVSLLLVSLALLCWPDTRASTRLRVITGQQARKRLRVPRPNTVTILVAAVVVGWLIAGLGGAVAAALLTATVHRQVRAHTERRRSLAAMDGLAEALRSFVASLRTGAHPAAAAESAAEDAHPRAAAAMRAIAAAARLDGDISAIRGTAHSPALDRVATAWRLAQRHGLPLAEVLDATRRDLEQRARFTRQVLARMTGPQASALALSFLPLLGIGLGEAIGAAPLRLLTTTGVGQMLLVTGVTLLCAGIMWSGRITNHVVPR